MEFTVKTVDIYVQKRHPLNHQKPPVQEFPFQVCENTNIVAFARNEQEVNIECLKAALRKELSVK